MGVIEGALISAGGNLLGGLLGKSKPRRAMALARDAILAQEKYGINALELIRSGAGQGMTAPKIGSPTAFANAFDTVSDLLTGKTAQEAEMNRIRTELAKLELEKQRAVRNVPVGVASPSLMVRTDQGPKVMSEIAQPTPINAVGSPDPQIDDGGTGVRLKPIDRVVTSSGTADLTVGPDADEAATGLVVGWYTDNVRRSDENAMAGMAGEKYTEQFLERNKGRSVTWDDRFGGVKPSGWDDWSNEEKLAYIIQTNKTKSRRTPLTFMEGFR